MKTISSDTIQASSYLKTVSVCSPLMQTHTCYSGFYKWLKNVNTDLPHPCSSPHMLCEPRTLNHQPLRHGYKNKLTKNKDTNLHNAPAIPSKGSPVWDWELNCLFGVALSSFTVDGNPQHVCRGMQTQNHQLLHAVLAQQLSSVPFYCAHPLTVVAKLLLLPWIQLMHCKDPIS